MPALRSSGALALRRRLRRRSDPIATAERSIAARVGSNVAPLMASFVSLTAPLLSRARLESLADRSLRIGFNAVYVCGLSSLATDLLRACSPPGDKALHDFGALHARLTGIRFRVEWGLIRGLMVAAAASAPPPSRSRRAKPTARLVSATHPPLAANDLLDICGRGMYRHVDRITNLSELVKQRHCRRPGAGPMRALERSFVLDTLGRVTELLNQLADLTGGGGGGGRVRLAAGVIRDAQLAREDAERLLLLLAGGGGGRGRGSAESGRLRQRP